MALKPGHGISQWEIATTKKLVNEFRRRTRLLARDEFDDLVQDCLLHWLSVRHKITHDPDKPPVGYMAQVLRNKLTDWVREQRCEKRGGGIEWTSLDATIDGADEGLTLAEILDASETPLAVGDEEILQELRIDLGRALVRLNPSQRLLCRLLGEEGLSIKEAAERLEIPRGTLYEEIKRIRKALGDFGMAEYLGPSIGASKRSGS